MENEFILIKKDVDEAHMNKVELESRLEGLTDEINFLRQLYEEEVPELQSQISNLSVVLSMDNSHSLDMDGVIARSAPSTRKSPTGMRLRTRTKSSPAPGLKDQRASLEAAIADAEQLGELAIKDASAKMAQLEAALQQAKPNMARQLSEYQKLRNVKLALDFEIATYHKLLEGEESRLESGMQNMSIYTKTTSGYSGGLTYRGLTRPGLSYGLSSFQSRFSSGRGSSPFTRTSSTKAVVVKKIVMGSCCRSPLMSCPSERPLQPLLTSPPPVTIPGGEAVVQGN
ncbi:Keratin, type II cytoskeletal 8 [Tupaia chinensis]|uniref:Keratin, type II cytoskeletal 8 n=1 Tax=Tupaia chinensis TaxID=246437 RepID=L9LAG8_TUPCH|nr:Keratin, type II cytoskeletal 8 [Tupaia chinensis]